MDYIKIKNCTYDSFIEKNIEASLTLFTPTFNRSACLFRLYNDMLRQTDKRFCWLVVNDGSKDETNDVMQSILEREEIPILYLEKENGGKHSAFKCALQECKTRYFICMDDDDKYSDDAVSFFLNKWKDAAKLRGGQIGAIRTLTMRSDSSYICTPALKYEELGMEYVATTLECQYEHKRRMENWTCYETAKLRSVELFPTNYWMSPQHKFFSESIWQGRFARKYSCLYVNIALREYAETSDSILRGFKSHQHYVDMFINNHIILTEQYDYIRRNPKELLRYVVFVTLLRGYIGGRMIVHIKHTPQTSLRFLLLVMAPIAFLGKKIIEHRNR